MNAQEQLTLEELNLQLKKRVQEECAKNRQKDKMLFAQNKLASMGEMIENIAHQWRQPLMELSSILMQLEANIRLKQELSKEEVLKAIGQSNEITRYMSETIDDFKNFFITDKQKVQFRATEQINLCVGIIGNSLKKDNIKLEIYVKKNPLIEGYKNEYTQVLINIINNAFKIFLKREIPNPKIIITINEDEESSIVTIQDNAGGIPEAILDKIFDPFFTQDTPKGRGLGLFMSKLIIENSMKGKLSVQNYNDGAIFTVRIPK
ncbi:MAG: sensor histidine kinase [Candidatus Marinarcus sp.]|uniref:sensor histidine kinase n=1 Tax=Candidatus Marinarcus sp. TaxID=3100987 RepID=UPI003B00EA3B